MPHNLDLRSFTGRTLYSMTLSGHDLIDHSPIRSVSTVQRLYWSPVSCGELHRPPQGTRRLSHWYDRARLRIYPCRTVQPLVECCRIVFHEGGCSLSLLKDRTRQRSIARLCRKATEGEKSPSLFIAMITLIDFMRHGGRMG